MENGSHLLSFGGLLNLLPSFRTSLMVQGLSLHVSTARGTGSILGGGTNIPYAGQCGQKGKYQK